MQPHDSSLPAEHMAVFVGGFDPRGAKHYQQLMRQQAQQQREVDGRIYHVGARAAWQSLGAERVRHSQWTVQPAQGRATDYVFYEWSDIVRQHWDTRWWHVVGSAWGHYREIARMPHDWRQMYQQKPYTLWTLLYPALYLLLTLLLSVALVLGLLALWPHALGAMAALVAAAGVWRGSFLLDRLLHVTWLLRIFRFAVVFARASEDPLAQRHQAMAQALAQRLRAQPQLQVTVVGFSVGSAMSIGLLHALRAQLEPAQWQRVQWLTLGNCIPLFSLVRGAHTLREQLASLASDGQLYWADISAPADSVSFGDCELLRLAMGRHPQAQAGVWSAPQRMCSPRFHTLFVPHAYRRLRRNKMRMHFQYLMAAQLPGAYDYLALLTHPQGLQHFVSERLVR